MNKNHRRKNKFLTLCATVCSLLVAGQDIQFTQFYASPLYLNPAFAGANVCSRLMSNYRNQWPGIKKAYTSYSVAFDHSVPKLNSGIGFLATNDVAGTGSLRTTSFYGLYSYEMWINRKWAARAGVQAGGTLRGINFGNLIFADQIARGNAPVTVEIPTASKFFFDVSAGALVYNRQYWFGATAHHLTTPNQSLIGGESLLPIKFSFHTGINLPVGSGAFKKKKSDAKNYVSPALNYKAQAKFDQLDVGFYYTYSPLVLGVWYRGIPVLKNYEPQFINHDAIAFIIGIEANDFKFGYSYDVTISKLGTASSGAHEVSVAYQFCDFYQLKKRKKKVRQNFIVPCAKF